MYSRSGSSGLRGLVLGRISSRSIEWSHLSATLKTEWGCRYSGLHMKMDTSFFPFKSELTLSPIQEVRLSSAVTTVAHYTSRRDLQDRTMRRTPRRIDSHLCNLDPRAYRESVNRMESCVHSSKLNLVAFASCQSRSRMW